MRRITAEQRRARLGVVHKLAGAKAGDVNDVARALVALHATDPATVYLSVRARLRRPASTVEALDRALYDDRSLVKLLAMRRTLFVVPADLVAFVRAGVSVAVEARERRRLIKEIEEQGITTDGAAWLARAEADVLALLRRRGELFAADITRAVPALGAKLRFGEGKKWQAETSVGPRVLTVLDAGGRVVRGRPRGPWNTSVHRYAAVPDAPRPEPGPARAELVRRYLEAYGPATVEDVKWWTGWSLGDTRAAIAALDVEEVELEGEAPGRPGLVLAGTTMPPKPKPWVAFLPALDPTVMGWTHRDWYLDPAHRPFVVDRSGNVGPTVWADGRVIGAWAQTKATGEVRYRLLEAGPEAAVAKEARRLQEWLGGVVVTPRFPAPLDRELSAGLS